MRRALLIATLATSLAVPVAAHAHGDEPAVDALSAQDVYLPHRPAVPEETGKALRTTLERSRAAGYPLKVAVIATTHDLGELEQLFGRPQPTAGFISRLVGKNRPVPLLVVMPAGYGTIQAGPNAKAALAGLKPPSSGSGDSLTRAAITATLRLARAAGHPVPAPEISSGTSPALVAGVAVLLLALAGALVAIRMRQSRAAS
jgi:hypothetical protein